jgi:hypothetical protein
MGLSARPAGGYDKKTQGEDVAGILDELNGEYDLPVPRPNMRRPDQGRIFNVTLKYI